MNNEIATITTHDVESRIIKVRGQKVIIDCEVAELYGAETKRINEAVRNNPEGIAAKDLWSHYDELLSIYRSQSVEDPSRLEDAVDALCEDSRAAFKPDIAKKTRLNCLPFHQIRW